MSELVVSKNYTTILKNFFKYIPSRLFTVLNSLVVIPFFAYFLSAGEMGMFQLCLGILNLVCTCSTDWISKSVLRFWVKYKEQGKLDNFLSNIIVISLVAYLLILLIYFLFSDYVIAKFQISRDLLLLTLFLVIPCGVRQLLYQLLRIFDKPFLYAFSIVFYQISLLLLFLIFSQKFSNVHAILLAMSCSIFVLDFYIIQQIKSKENVKFSINKDILVESLRYSLPLVITNISLWVVFNSAKFIFQYNHDTLSTAQIGVCTFFTTNSLTLFFSTFLFSVFPLIISKFEKKNFIKEFVTNTIQLYCAIFIPIVGIFCFFSKEITVNLLSAKYMDAHVLLPFTAIAAFGHELLKLINLKYHLKNRTYIEMIFSVVIGLITLGLNIFLLPKSPLYVAGLMILLPIVMLLIVNSYIKFSSIDYLDNFKVFKTAIFSVLIAVVSFVLIQYIMQGSIFEFSYFAIVKVVSFVALYYAMLWPLRKVVL